MFNKKQKTPQEEGRLGVGRVAQRPGEPRGPPLLCPEEQRPVNRGEGLSESRSPGPPQCSAVGARGPHPATEELCLSLSRVSGGS